MATRLDALVAWLDGVQHLKKRGHWPDWLYLGENLPSSRQCIKCLKGGTRQWTRTWTLATRPMPL